MKSSPKQHDHDHSLFLRCLDCHRWGTPMPNDTQCGNCSSLNTVEYFPRCCLAKAFAEGQASKMSIDDILPSEELLAEYYDLKHTPTLMRFIHDYVKARLESEK